MCIKPADAFTLCDLAIFDGAHMRNLIGTTSGAVPPALLGRAFAGDQTCEPAPTPCLASLADRIERALPPDDRADFAQARQRPTSGDARTAAQRKVLGDLFWELTYWKTPEEYERLTAGEQVHLGALDVARVNGALVLDAGAGSGRLTLPLARRAHRVYALDPAPPMLRLLEDKLAAASLRNVEVLRGTFRQVPLPDNSVDAVVACSSFGTDEARGGRCGLDELRRVTRPGGRIVILWPRDPAWFLCQGFAYTMLPGHLTNTFATLDDAWAVATRFYGPAVARHLETTGQPELPFHVLGVTPPRDVCWLTVRK